MFSDEMIEKIIREYIGQNYHMSLATSADGKPWVCEVHFAVDDQLHIYWRSKTDRRHSQEIALNPNVAGNIVVQHGLTDKPRGVYFEGVAERLFDVSLNDVAYTVIADRQQLGPEIIDDTHSPDGHQFYKITVSTWYLFDAKDSNPSNKYPLTWSS